MISNTKIKILINTLPVNFASGGIKSFLIELLLALDKSHNKSFEYNLICSHLNEKLFDCFNNNKRFKKIIVKINNKNPLTRIFFEQFRMNKLFKNEKNAIVLNICNVAIMFCSLPQVTIIQAPLSIASLRRTLPQKYISLGVFHKIYYDLLVNRSINISSRTVAVSYFIREFLGTYKLKVNVISEGVNIQHFNNSNDESSKFLSSNYILSVSTLFPYKNMDKVIEAYSIFRKKGYSFKLLIAGKDPDNSQLKYLKEIVKKNDLKDDVVFTGRIPYDEIPSLYKGASLFLYLSSVETFGLPVLEAMASKVPVIASNQMSIPEIVNDAGILVNPDDVEDIAKKIELVLTSESKRNDLIKKGIENINLYSWNATASKFEELFEQVIENDSRLNRNNLF